MSVLQLSQHGILYLISIVERKQKLWRIVRVMYDCIHSAISQWRLTGSCKVTIVDEGYFQVICITLQHRDWKVKAHFTLQAALFCCTSHCCALCFVQDTHYPSRKAKLGVSSELWKASLLLLLWALKEGIPPLLQALRGSGSSQGSSRLSSSPVNTL